MAIERAAASMPSVTTNDGRLDIGDSTAIDRAADPARRPSPTSTASHQYYPACSDQAADHADQPHDRADRQVYAAGDDHRGHAQGHDADDRQSCG